MSDPWQTLGIVPGASPEAIRAAYLRLVRIHHPDRYRNDPVRYRQEEDRMKEINAAYRQLVAGGPVAPPRRPAPGPRPRPVDLRNLKCGPHRRWAVGYCTACAAPLCSRCDPALSGWCDRHRGGG
ncbi:MAG: J domain-containing protein [Thermaerobacter sp.]|nr:J domain-containing protein [Thermaerobacter sp.]